ncbi:uncharacterized protein LOC143765064 isoform X1 [Ranitomeya variabilis]|uniref:uncharacterized protein LOC143765064 isoform X1 n=1 Tax=Ranitomeya variabilis TaxID=490064 RepID=UPI004057017A
MHCFTVIVDKYNMLLCSDHIEHSSSSDQNSKDVDKRNGFHKSSYSLTNGNKTGRARSNSEDPSSIQELSSPDMIEKEFNQFHFKGKELIQILEKDPKNLEAVSRFVQNHKGTSIKWENSDCCLRLCDLGGTIYMGQKFMQESWEECYLAKPTKMQVFGTLENIQVMLPSVQWIILVGEDGWIYAYGEEELHLVAKSLQEFVENGISNIYSTFVDSDASDEEGEPLHQDEEILKIRQRTKDFVNKSANEFDDFLSFISS